MDAATERHPVGLLQEGAELLLDVAQHAVEEVEIAVFAVVVDHEAGDHVHDRLDLFQIPFAQPREGAGGVREIEARGGDAGVQAQAADDAGGLFLEAGQLADRVEDDLVGMADHLVDFVIGIGHRIGMGFLAETLMAEADFVKRRRGRAVHVIAHEIEDRPGGEAFECQKRLCAGEFAQGRDLLHVLQELGFVDQVIGSLDQGSILREPSHIWRK